MIAATLRAAADQIVGFFGADVLFDAVTQTVDPLTGIVTETRVTSTMKGALVKFKERDLDGTAVRVQDRKVFLRATDVEDAGINLSRGDRLRVAGITWEVLDISAIRPEGTTVVWRLHVRQ